MLHSGSGSQTRLLSLSLALFVIVIVIRMLSFGTSIEKIKPQSNRNLSSKRCMENNQIDIAIHQCKISFSETHDVCVFIFPPPSSGARSTLPIRCCFVGGAGNSKFHSMAISMDDDEIVGSTVRRSANPFVYVTLLLEFSCPQRESFRAPRTHLRVVLVQWKAESRGRGGGRRKWFLIRPNR